MLNSFSGVGRICAAKVDRTNSGVMIVKFLLGIPRDKRKGEETAKTDFINCTIIGNSGEYFSKWVEVGDLVDIRGTLQTTPYEKNGMKITAYEVIVGGYHLLKKANPQPQPQTPPPAPPIYTAPAPAPAPAPQITPEESAMLPFDFPPGY